MILEAFRKEVNQGRKGMLRTNQYRERFPSSLRIYKAGGQKAKQVSRENITWLRYFEEENDADSPCRFSPEILADANKDFTASAESD